jgi:hypothetical protein
MSGVRVRRPDPVRAVREPPLPCPVLDDAVEAREGYPVPPGFELGQKPTPADRSRAGPEDRHDKVERPGGYVSHAGGRDAESPHEGREVDLSPLDHGHIHEPVGSDRGSRETPATPSIRSG